MNTNNFFITNQPMMMKTKFLLFMVLFASSIDLMAQCGFFDGFESGTYSPTWSVGSGLSSVNVITSNPNPYAGTYSIQGLGGNSTHLTGISTTIPSQTPDSISWAIYPTSSGSANYFVAGDASVSAVNCIMFCYWQGGTNIRFVSSITYSLTTAPNAWYYIQVKNINWAAHTFDIYINGTLQATAFPFRSASQNSISNIHLYNFNSSTAVWDNIRVGNSLVPAAAGADKIGCNNNDVVMSPLPPTSGSGAWTGGAGTWNVNTYTPSVGENSAGATVDAVWTVTSGGCTDVDSAVITVTPILPAPSITTTANSVCANTSVTLTANPAQGYTNAEYVWYKNGSMVNYQNGGPGTYVVNSGNVAATNDYKLSVVYSGYGCTSTLSASNTVVTNVPSSVITPSGPTSFCTNSPTTLNATAGMSNYVWKRSNVTVGTNSASYIPTASGNHNVTVTDANGCSKTSAWTNIIVNSLPTANAGVDKVLCEGSTVQIGSANNAANTYTWSPLDGVSNVYISNPMVSATGTVVYTVTVTNTSTGCSNTDAMQVNLLSLPPTPSLSSTPQGNLIHLTSNTPGASTVNWYKDGVALYANQAANSSINVYASNPQKAYTVKSKGANGCLSLASNSINVRLGGDKGGDLVIGDLGFTAYPNPTSGLLRVSIIGGKKDDGDLLLYNGLGQVVLREDVFLMGGNGEIELDLGGLAVGVYSLVYEGFVVKVVKE